MATAVGEYRRALEATARAVFRNNGVDEERVSVVERRAVQRIARGRWSSTITLSI